MGTVRTPEVGDPKFAAKNASLFVMLLLLLQLLQSLQLLLFLMLLLRCRRPRGAAAAP